MIFRNNFFNVHLGRVLTNNEGKSTITNNAIIGTTRGILILRIVYPPGMYYILDVVTRERERENLQKNQTITFCNKQDDTVWNHTASIESK